MSVLNNCKAYLIMTPHVGEMSRLTGKDIKYIRDNSIYVAKDFASEHMKNGGVCVLKDYRCFVADGNGGLYMNVTGNNGMSTAGSGDVLAGMIAGLTARVKLCDINLEHKEIFGLPVCRCYNGNDVELVQSAVWLHGKAGDIAAKRKGQYGMIAGDIVEAIPEAIEGAIRHE
jgi:NAD(P)H-hydrate epimerase